MDSLGYPVTNTLIEDIRDPEDLAHRKKLYCVRNTTLDYLLGFEEKLIFFGFGRLTCEILDQPNKDGLFGNIFGRKSILH